jgi:hypothetical protein
MKKVDLTIDALLAHPTATELHVLYTALALNNEADFITFKEVWYRKTYSIMQAATGCSNLLTLATLVSDVFLNCWINRMYFGPGAPINIALYKTILCTRILQYMQEEAMLQEIEEYRKQVA